MSATIASPINPEYVAISAMLRIAARHLMRDEVATAFAQFVKDGEDVVTACAKALYVWDL